jgi:hypothetical protein
MSSRRRRGVAIVVVGTLFVACVAVPLRLRIQHRAAVATRLTRLDVPVYQGATGVKRVFDRPKRSTRSPRWRCSHGNVSPVRQ